MRVSLYFVWEMDYVRYPGGGFGMNLGGGSGIRPGDHLTCAAVFWNLIWICKNKRKIVRLILELILLGEELFILKIIHKQRQFILAYFQIF